MSMWLCNVVWYDGSDAYVNKFVLQSDASGITKQSEWLLGEYFGGLGEVLKIDKLYPVTLDEVTAFSSSEDDCLRAAYCRFKEFYFAV